MLKKTRNIALMAGVLAAVSFGGSALAAAGAATVQPTHVAVPAKATTQKAADKETADGNQKSADAETADGAEFGHNEADQETSDGAPEAGSEVPGNDGPGGHADEPGNPDAQHEAGGQTEE
jgi:hypothetical protein